MTSARNPLHFTLEAQCDLGIMPAFSRQRTSILFKNLHLFQLKAPETLSPETLERQLATRLFRPCGSLETATLGWVPPLDDAARTLVHRANHCLLLCARRQERLLPASVITEILEERVLEREQREMRSIGRRERRQLREEILSELLPRAFTHSRRIRVYVDLQTHWLLVDAASTPRAEEVVSLLRKTLGSLPVQPPHPQGAPAQHMTRWVSEGQVPGGLELGDACELRDPRDSGSVVRCRGQDLGSEAIAAHIRAGKQVVKLALEWPERGSFMLQEDLSIRRLRLADALRQTARDDLEDERARLDAEFFLLTQTLRELCCWLEERFSLHPSAETGTR